MNGKRTKIILDTVSTASIISLNLVRKLGLESKLITVFALKQAMSIADERTIYSIGILENTLVDICPGITRKLDALCCM